MDAAGPDKCFDDDEEEDLEELRDDFFFFLEDDDIIIVFIAMTPRSLSTIANKSPEPSPLLIDYTPLLEKL